MAGRNCQHLWRRESITLWCLCCWVHVSNHTGCPRRHIIHKLISLGSNNQVDSVIVYKCSNHYSIIYRLKFSRNCASKDQFSWNLGLRDENFSKVHERSLVFVNLFCRWLDKLGIAALAHHSRVFRQTFVGGVCGLLDYHQNPLPVSFGCSLNADSPTTNTQYPYCTIGLLAISTVQAACWHQGTLCEG